LVVLRVVALLRRSSEHLRGQTLTRSVDGSQTPPRPLRFRRLDRRTKENETLIGIRRGSDGVFNGLAVKPGWLGT
ncbi:unnamed protein product, partial [Musa acuminata subsp. burmannicoides]